MFAKVRGWSAGFFLAVLVGLGLGVSASPGQGAVILTVDISNPRYVTFTATGAYAENEDFDTWLTYGFTLVGFFDSSVDDGGFKYLSPANLYSPAGGYAYTELASIDFYGGWDHTDLNIYTSRYTSQNWSTSAAAFTGSATADLRSWAAYFTSAGTVGSVYSDSESRYGTLLGQYQVVPEPSTMGLLLMVGVALLGYRSRRNRATA